MVFSTRQSLYHGATLRPSSAAILVIKILISSLKSHCILVILGYSVTLN